MCSEDGRYGTWEGSHPRYSGEINAPTPCRRNGLGGECPSKKWVCKADSNEAEIKEKVGKKEVEKIVGVWKELIVMQGGPRKILVGH